MGFFKPNIRKMRINRDIEGLIIIFKHKDSRLILGAVEALKEIGKEAVESLLKALDDKNSSVRWYTARTLGEIGDENAIDCLIKTFMNDEDESVRDNAGSALVDIGGERVRDELYKVVNKGDKNNIERAIIRLGQLGDSRVVEQLIKWLKGKNKYAAASCLGFIGDIRAVEPLINALRTTEISFKTDLVRSLGKIGDKRALEPIKKQKIEIWSRRYEREYGEFFATDLYAHRKQFEEVASEAIKQIEEKKRSPINGSSLNLA